MASNYGGFDYSFVDKKLVKFSCNICMKVLRDPHLTKCCGQHFCESCLDYWNASNQRANSCPQCRTGGKEFQHFLDKKLKREIDSLRIHCTNKEAGCQWIGELGYLKDHLEAYNGCGYVGIECPNRCLVLKWGTYFEDNDYLAVKKLLRKDLANHLENECYRRPHRCEYCGYNDTYEAITGYGRCHIQNGNCHYNECPEIPLDCPNIKCGRINIKRKDMDEHRSQCPLEPVQCPFEEAGCKVMLVRRELEQHMSTTQQQHLQMVMEAYKELKRQHEEMKDRNRRTENRLYDAEDELDELQKRLNQKRSHGGH